MNEIIEYWVTKVIVEDLKELKDLLKRKKNIKSIAISLYYYPVVDSSFYISNLEKDIIENIIDKRAFSFYDLTNKEEKKEFIEDFREIYYSQKLICQENS
jgi:hypothetical protein